ncbi:MAG: NAD-dependent epimerase/dehydratase family protein [Thermoanaerobaculia bacterium]|nr:NAD-dependent epimerase/dehydratase family protein [Thermoanaerobaculia bacterium]
MKIFITGATGYIGSAVALDLRARGHEVTALVRAGRPAGALREAGVKLVEGTLGTILDHLAEIEANEVYVHTALSDDADKVLNDENAIEALTRFRHGGRYFIYTSGTWVLGNAGPAVDDEAMPPEPVAYAAWRPKHERIVLEASRDGFDTAVIRPGCIYGRSQSLLRGWFEAARDGRPVEIVGDGTNRWAMVDLTDLVDCYRLAIEQRATGILHAVDDTRATLREMADAVVRAKGSKSTIVAIPPDTARLQMGAFADALLLDQHVSSAWTRQHLGWAPRREFISSVGEQWREFS